MHEVRAIHDLLTQIKHGEILLPEFQRGYVWNRDQVRGLMQSLYRKHPTGHLLIWRTYKPAAVRDGEKPRDGHAFLTQRASLDIRRSGPAEYLPAIRENQPGALRAQSIPMDRELWESENYRDFLAGRRRLLAQAMNDFIAGWATEDPSGTDEQTVRRLIAGGEGGAVEFKSSLRWDLREAKVNKALEKVIVKTLAGFLNGRGGALLIGVEDAGIVVGLGADYDTLRKKDRDGFELHLRELVVRDLGEAASVFLTVTFHEIDVIPALIGAS